MNRILISKSWGPGAIRAPQGYFVKAYLKVGSKDVTDEHETPVENSRYSKRDPRKRRDTERTWSSPFARIGKR